MPSRQRCGRRDRAQGAGESADDCLNAGWGPSIWGRVIGQQIDNRYRAFADPRASGQLLGFQSGIDLLRGEWLPGHRDAAGIYFAYANANVDVTGRVTNEAATNYVLRRTGGLNLDAQSGAAYWTHYGPSGWYLDAVAQATRYQGSASTQFAGLATTGFGFVSSLETGHPIYLPMFGPGFVLEPQAQIVWQRVSFDDANIVVISFASKPRRRTARSSILKARCWLRRIPRQAALNKSTAPAFSHGCWGSVDHKSRGHQRSA